MRHATLLLGTLLAAIVTPLSGQNLQDPPCGGLEDKQAVMEDLARYFVKDDLAPVREGAGIEELSEGFSRHVVDRRKECGRVLGAVNSFLQRTTNGNRAGGTEKLEFAIFRFGPYYGVLVERPKPDPDAEKIELGYARLLLFDASTLDYLGGILT